LYNCHGGDQLVDYTGFPNASSLQTSVNSHSPSIDIPHFIGFDVKSFFYSIATNYARSDQEENIRKLNNSVLATNPTQAIIDYITASYGSFPGTTGKKI